MGFVDFSGVNRESGGPSNRASNLLTGGSSPISTGAYTDAGRVSLSVSDLPGSALKSAGNVTAGFVGTAKGLVSLVENLPIIGGITKPLIGFTGGIVDATIGQVVRGAENLKIGEQSLAQATANALEVIGTPLKWGMDALVAPGQFVQNEVAKARINSTLKGQDDFIRTVFGDAPAEAVNAVRGGKTIEEAALQLSESNAGFSADSAQNLIWSLILDPMNLVTAGVGKAVGIGSRASQYAKFLKGGIEVMDFGKSVSQAEKAAKIAEATVFLDKWDWAGKIYDATIGRAKGAFALLAPKMGKEITKVVVREFNPADTNFLLNTIERISGTSGRNIAENGLRNFAITAAGAVRSGIVRHVSTLRRVGSENFTKSVVSFVEREIRNGSDVAKILAHKIEDNASLAQVMERSGIAADEATKFIEDIANKAKQGVRADEMLRSEELQKFLGKFSRGHSNWTVKNKTQSLREQIKFMEQNDARIGAEQATRIFSDLKIEQATVAKNAIDKIAAGGSVEEAMSGFIDDLVNGFGQTRKDAIQTANDVFGRYVQVVGGKVVKSDVRGLGSALAIGRAANYGRTVEGLALIRSRIRAAVEQGTIKLVGKYKPEDVEKLSRMTLVSRATFTTADAAEYEARIAALKSAEKAAVEAGDEAAAKAARVKMAELADEAVYRFDDLKAAFDPKNLVDGVEPAASKAANRYAYDDVFDWMAKAKDGAVQAITSDEMTMLQKLAQVNPIIRDLLAFADKDLSGAGYRLGFAPKSGVIEKNTLRHLDDGTEMWQGVFMPYTDTLDMVDIANLDKSLAGVKLRPSKVDTVLDLFTRKYGPETMRAAVTERFITSMVQRSGVSVRKARALLTEINNLAASLNVRPQALFFERNFVNEIFKKNLTEIEYRQLIMSGSDPMKEILRAAAGDFRTAGLTSGFTGRVKAIAPAISLVTDRLWGEVRFGRSNPYFQLILERIETEFQLIANGIYRKVSDAFGEEYKGTILIRNLRNRANASSEFADGMVYHTRARTQGTMAIVEQAPGIRGITGRAIQSVREKLKNFASIDRVMVVKQGAADIMSNRNAVNQVIDILNRARPDIFPLLAKHYGATSADDVMELVLGEMIRISEPALRAEWIAQNGKIARSLAGKEIVSDIAATLKKEYGYSAKAAAEEAQKLADNIANEVVGAFEIALERGARAADQAQYFSSYRTWFERSINHPFLALYPYSYMTQKAIPSMLKLLFQTRLPSGLLMPGIGYIKYQQIAEYMADEMNSNSGFIGQILNSEPLMLLMSSLLPTSPEDMGFSVTSAARTKIIAPALAGQDINMRNIEQIGQGIRDSVWAGSFPGQLERLSRTGRQTFAQPGQEININQAISNPIEGMLAPAQDLLRGSGPEIQQQVQQGLGDLRNP